MKDRFFSYVIILLGAFCLIPFFLQAYFVHPLGVHEWDWVTNLGQSLSNKSFIEEQLFYYKNVMGRYSSTFVSSLTDNYFSISSFKLFFIANLFTFVVITFFALKTLIGVKEKVLSAAITMLFCMSYFAGISGVQDTLFMLTSVHTYLFGYYGFVLMLVFWHLFYHSYEYKYLIFVTLISVFAIGTNEITALFTAGVNFFLFFYATLSKRIILPHLIILIVNIACILIAFCAPGNFIRYNGVPDSSTNLVLLALTSSIYILLSWFANGNVIICCVLLKFMLQDTFEHQEIYLRIGSKNYFKSMIVIILGIMFIICSIFVLVYSGKGTTFPERVLDLLYLAFLLTLFISIRYLPKMKFNYSVSKEVRYLVLFAFFISVTFSGIYINRENKNYTNYAELMGFSSNIGNAWLSVLSGESRAFDIEMKNQWEKVARCTTDTCFVPQLKSKPKHLYIKNLDRKNEISGEPYMGYYFHDRQIIVKYNR